MAARSGIYSIPAEEQRACVNYLIVCVRACDLAARAVRRGSRMARRLIYERKSSESAFTSLGRIRELFRRKDDRFSFTRYEFAMPLITKRDASR